MSTWQRRAERAENAINERHGKPVWGMPGTNLGLIAWPAASKDEAFVRWQYWWQSQYVECLVDAALRDPSKAKIKKVVATLRGIRARSLRGLKQNKCLDDRAWLAVAMQRAALLPGCERFAAVAEDLMESVVAGTDQRLGLIPWRKNEVFYNISTNAPVALYLARAAKSPDPHRPHAVNMGLVEDAMAITERIFDELLSDQGLIMDGVRMRMHGPELVPDIHPYCQGIMIGVCLEIALRHFEYHGLQSPIGSVVEAEKAAVAIRYIARLRNMVRAVARHMAGPSGVIAWDTGGGDGGLYKGILAHFLTQVATDLPIDGAANDTTRRLAKKMVIASAESVWKHRVEVDGLPMFPVEWAREARVPYNTTMVGASFNGSLSSSHIAERDLSVQLSAWMLVEGAAKISGE
ncbi:MAG: glycoside hydrolase family 76 [Corynebacterium sp.]|nr:glycoside hydrolase family 76 [Corynebacterium sp.]